MLRSFINLCMLSTCAKYYKLKLYASRTNFNEQNELSVRLLIVTSVFESGDNSSTFHKIKHEKAFKNY